MGNPVITRGPLTQKLGLEVSDLEVTLGVNQTTQYANVALASFAMAGGFDGARLTVRRFFAASWEDAEVVGEFWPLLLFAGSVAEVDVSASAVRLSAKSDVDILNRPLPRTVHMAPCTNTLYDTLCTLAAGDFSVSANVASGSTPLVVNTDLSEPDGYFELGMVTFTSGANSGVSRTVVSYSGSQVGVMPRLLVAPAPGDTFDIVPGCDKAMVTCNSKFNNLAHFRGFPFIPTPEATL